MAAATLKHAKKILKINRLLPITDGNNQASISLLNKLGLQFEKNIHPPEYKLVLLFS